MNLFWFKTSLKGLGFNNLHQDLDIMQIVHTAMDACQDDRSKKVYILKKI